ncbi:hypothetical protein GGF32_005847 [Allomyces javanicus]|nr:hypothetical protein GGF32_005844 [Allomyces javanicus]KAJ3362607.1 hypothetical protein GGF32_005847 [Allomyces javanicus]
MFRRTFSTTARRLADAAAESTSTSSLGRKRRGVTRAEKWLHGPGKMFEHVQPGMAQYVSYRADQPFPMNPLFRPAPPLADSVREDIYRTYLSGKVSVAQLAQRFRIAEARVKAVLALKRHEKAMIAEGAVIQSDFRTQMEKILRVQTRPANLDDKNIKPIRADPPYLLALDEDKLFNQEAALKMLKGAGGKTERKPKSEKARIEEAEARKKATKEVVTPRGTKLVINLAATVPQGHVKRVYKSTVFRA